MSDRHRHDVGEDDAGDLNVPDQPDRGEVRQERRRHVGIAEAKQIPSPPERIAEGDGGVLDIDQEGGQVVREMIAERDRDDRDTSLRSLPARRPGRPASMWPKETATP